MLVADDSSELDPASWGPDTRAGRAHTPNIAVVTPVLDDWVSLSRLIEEVSSLKALSSANIKFVVVDDGSTDFLPPGHEALRGPVTSIVTLKLGANQSHQRAIALGLAYIRREMSPDLVLVMDSDGEDRPEELEGLLSAHKTSPGAIIVARRRRRTEGLRFQLGYLVFKILFALLTGRQMTFGNFSLIPAQRLANVVCNANVWNHYAATLLRSRIPISFVDTDRGRRFAGQSKMNFNSLITHGMSAISVFSDIVITRLFVALLALFVLTAASMGAVLAAKLVVEALEIPGLFVPGYATTVLLQLMMIGVTSLLICLLAILSLLSSRAHVSAVPSMLLDHLVEKIVVVTAAEPLTDRAEYTTLVAGRAT